VRCRRIGCGDSFSGGRRATTIATFFGRLGPKATSRLTFWPAAIMRASAFTFSSRLSLRTTSNRATLWPPRRAARPTPPASLGPCGMARCRAILAPVQREVAARSAARPQAGRHALGEWNPPHHLQPRVRAAAVGVQGHKQHRMEQAEPNSQRPAHRLHPPEGGRSHLACSLHVRERSDTTEVAQSSQFCYLECKCSGGERGERRWRYKALRQGPLSSGRH
jgi:hypothetical protein